MKLDDINSLKELENVLLKELKHKNFDGEDFSIYEAFDRHDNAIIEKLTSQFDEKDRYIEKIGEKVVKWYQLEHEIPEHSIPYWVFMDYIATKAAIDPSITLEKYTKEYLKERYEYIQNYHV